MFAERPLPILDSRIRAWAESWADDPDRALLTRAPWIPWTLPDPFVSDEVVQDRAKCNAQLLAQACADIATERAWARRIDADRALGRGVDPRDGDVAADDVGSQYHSTRRSAPDVRTSTPSSSRPSHAPRNQWSRRAGVPRQDAPATSRGAARPGESRREGKPTIQTN